MHSLCTLEEGGHINYETAAASTFQCFFFFTQCGEVEGTLWRQVVVFAKQDNSQISLEYFGKPFFEKNMSKYLDGKYEMFGIG